MIKSNIDVIRALHKRREYKQIINTPKDIYLIFLYDELIKTCLLAPALGVP